MLPYTLMSENNLWDIFFISQICVLGIKHIFRPGKMYLYPQRHIEDPFFFNSEYLIVNLVIVFWGEMLKHTFLCICEGSSRD